jgi:hypothetical protein
MWHGTYEIIDTSETYQATSSLPLPFLPWAPFLCPRTHRHTTSSISLYAQLQLTYSLQVTHTVAAHPPVSLHHCGPVPTGCCARVRCRRPPLHLHNPSASLHQQFLNRENPPNRRTTKRHQISTNQLSSSAQQNAAPPAVLSSGRPDLSLLQRSSKSNSPLFFLSASLQPATSLSCRSCTCVAGRRFTGSLPPSPPALIPCCSHTPGTLEGIGFF